LLPASRIAGSGTYTADAQTYPNGCQVCEVEIDPETGVVRLTRLSAVDDIGAVVNPLIVEGQLHGGIAQGIGQALLEESVYDRGSGQLLTGSIDALRSFGVSHVDMPSRARRSGGCCVVDRRRRSPAGGRRRRAASSRSRGCVRQISRSTTIAPARVLPVPFRLVLASRGCARSPIGTRLQQLGRVGARVPVR
jgi:Molybdopterin cofactor-binding domain